MAGVAVLDIGKTNVKLAVVDPGKGAEIDVRTRPNAVRPGPPYPHFDIEGHWEFLLGALTDLGRTHQIGALSVTAHGATGVLLDADGGLALPVLDYEHDGPETVGAEYDAVRPDFAETGSPRLAVGLNLGAQIFWQMRTFPDAAARVRHVLTYPQYWSYRLSGTMAVEPTSLGCHTDLWAPWDGRFSSIVAAAGWERLMPPVRKAGEVLGPLLPDLARRTGLGGIPVFCGIHDSNASLYPHLLRREPPFSVVSTGTWVICMAVGGAAARLDPARDTLVNVDALGNPVPSARFMGGREYEIVQAGHASGHGPGDVAAVLDRRVMLLPAVEAGSGPFRGRAHRWTADPATSGERDVALSWYLALMTATCLEAVGAAGATVVEGPFAANAQYLAMLGAATGRPVVAAEGLTGTACGAALLADPTLPEGGGRNAPEPPAALGAYAADWRVEVERG